MRRLIFIYCFFLFSCSSTIKIIDKPIVFDAERKKLTLEYLENRYGVVQKEPKITPKIIVLHWTVFSTLEASFNAFEPSKLPNWRPDIKNVSGLNVSSQFMVDRNGTIYRLMHETTMARHVIGLNHCAIGIENVGGGKELPLTKEQLQANIDLIHYLKEKYPDIDFLIGHYEYTKFEGTPLWLEKNANYRTKKTDPGTFFMKNIREATQNLEFKEIPNF
ncbi:N-acetylmuramoyl-L-alanine amidase [Maribacter vaceletii]|uniref:N-acetylmuramoyl-L-alanine amidase n=1 Tax=Maribacter vaceletii TaxID=1206816 RepID=A0A495E7W0_9FLAO|nr:peptidoglycan recognition family protein [Maribacter vaceletii]RKR13020.1 N-acetylmuramoyl-L-alanine amidase [Maribacter vaceletii]